MIFMGNSDARKGLRVKVWCWREGDGGVKLEEGVTCSYNDKKYDFIVND